jgi:hypothetical protein
MNEMKDAGLKTPALHLNLKCVPSLAAVAPVSGGFQNLCRRTKGEHDRMATMPMDEGRKRVIGIMAAVMAAPRLKDWNWDGRAGAPACESIVITAIGAAERILEIIDQRQGRPMSKVAGGR